MNNYSEIGTKKPDPVLADRAGGVLLHHAAGGFAGGVAAPSGPGAARVSVASGAVPALAGASLGAL